MSCAQIGLRPRRDYISPTKTVSIREAQDRFDELSREVEQGETVTVTRDGKPVFKLVPHEKAAEKKGGLDLEAGQAYLRSRVITNPVP